ncbi:MAG: polysaccharide pyruvyl transferase family protein [Bacteroidales bacterium]|jgi:glycosyltransferase involved in cell wall biosynthesis|nr:polysaccharide pyruvyl transferase family protein [Bacteroidales bacterium]
MKIGILTQPLHNNYGGLLQAYAMQTVLRRMGHQPLIIDRQYPPHRNHRRTALEAQVAVHTRAFTAQNIWQRTPRLYSRAAMIAAIEQFAPDAIIVGSDQTWRPCYSPDLDAYFLDFLEQKTGIKRIAYAASFGVDNWELTEAQSARYTRLLKLFDAVSVREDSGVKLCSQYLDCTAQQMPDPVLLLSPDDLLFLTARAETPPSKGTMMTYILDQTEKTQHLVAEVARRNALLPFSVMAKKYIQSPDDAPADCTFPPVEQWLRGFSDAEAVVTDSFHGCLLSIMFHKPFICTGNAGRGMTRMMSLLRTFGLQNHLIATTEQLPEQLPKPDWQTVDAITTEQRRHGLTFLSENLNTANRPQYFPKTSGKHPAVSIIVAAYNAEKYIIRCLDSLLAQTFVDFELLLINDGSTDHTSAICREYARRDARIRIIQQEHGGIGLARRRGIEEACGTYSIHVDSDDWVEPDALCSMYDQCVNNGLDLLVVDFEQIQPDGNWRREGIPDIVPPDDLLSGILNNYCIGSLWNKLVRHSLYRKFNIVPPNVSYCEDVAVMAQLLPHRIKVGYLPCLFIHYDCTIADSLTRNKTADTINRQLDGLARIEAILAPYAERYAAPLNRFRLQFKMEIFRSGLFSQQEYDRLLPYEIDSLPAVGFQRFFLKLAAAGHLHLSHHLWKAAIWLQKKTNRR